MDRLVRRWRSMRGHSGLRYWFVVRGTPVLLACLALYVVNGLAIGWRVAYDVGVGITSPADTTQPVLAWLLSIAGWLVAPGIAGAVAGYVVTAFISGRRRKPIAELFAAADDD